MTLDAVANLILDGRSTTNLDSGCLIKDKIKLINNASNQYQNMASERQNVKREMNYILGEEPSCDLQTTELFL